ncbi:MAG: tetratricopeptide repeat protein [Actinobacteria bacterium]|nr:tetratricopeptide repeat protein [Actinomycetota bacterium]
MDRRDTATLYAEGQAAYKTGDIDTAIDRFEAVVDSDPTFAKATAKLAGLLHHKAKLATREGLYADALPLFRRSFELYPGDPKLPVRFAVALRGRARQYLAEGEREVARHLLQEVLELVVDDTEAEGLLLALADLPERPLDEVRPLPPHDRGPDLVVVEAGVSPVILPAYLRLMPEGHVVVTESRLSDKVARLSPGGITALLDHGTEGLQSLDVRVATQTDPLGERIVALIASNLPSELHHIVGVDLLDRMSYRVGDSAFAVGKTVTVLADLLRSGRYRQVIFLLGDNRLNRTVRGFAEERFGPDRVLSYWASSRAGLYDALPWTSDEYHDRAAGVTPPVLVEPPTLWPLPRTASRTGHRPRRRRRSTPTITVIASPMAQHVQNSAPVLECLTDRAVIDIPLLGTKETSYIEYRDLAERYPGRVELDDHLALLTSEHDAAIGLPSILWWTAREALAQASGRSWGVDDVDIWPVLEPHVERLVRARLPAYRRFAIHLDRHLERRRPDALILAPDRFPEARIAAALARRHRVPSLFPQAAVFSASPRWKPLQADWIAVHDDHTRDLYIDYFGCAPHRILMTGIPRFTALVTRREELLARARPQGSSSRVLLALQRYAETYCERLLGAVASGVAQVPDARLDVRMHPRDPESRGVWYEGLLARHLSPDHFTVGHGGAIAEQLVEADLVVSGWSTVVIEAAILDRRVLSVNLTGEPLPVPYVDVGLADGATTEDQTRHGVVSLLTDPAVREASDRRRHAYFERNPHLVADNPAGRVARAVLALATGADPAALLDPAAVPGLGTRLGHPRS